MKRHELGGALLASVSRSFYLTIKALPRQLREPVGLGYLLARAADTIADSAEAPVEVRLRQLQVVRSMIESGADKPGLELLKREIVPADAAERELIVRLGEALDWLESMPVLDRADIVDVLRKITRGQELDLLRFGKGEGIAALQTAGELDEYTYLVAGCVGEFWTRLCFRHLPGFTKLSEQDMRALGVNFGKGLQLVNILRDLPADLKNGRCYLPLAEFGLDPDAISRTPQLGRAVFESWLAQAVNHLDAAYRYIRATSNWRLRYACILPWVLGLRTLILLRENPPLENSGRVKVSRSEVRRVLVKALSWAGSNFLLRIGRDRLLREYYCKK
jgi:farnesyl-diphosphate farnesyltransferase